jgi:hypothetical protein
MKRVEKVSAEYSIQASSVAKTCCVAPRRSSGQFLKDRGLRGNHPFLVEGSIAVLNAPEMADDCCLPLKVRLKGLTTVA